ncbi:MAG: hypothetical protein ACXV3C_04285 [Actinomycetes bacterium]
MYAWCQDMPGVSAADYEKVLAELGGAEKTAPGLVAHVAGPVEGGYRIVDVWETRDDAERFRQQHLESAVRNAHDGDERRLQAGFTTLEVTG